LNDIKFLVRSRFHDLHHLFAVDGVLTRDRIFSKLYRSAQTEKIIIGDVVDSY